MGSQLELSVLTRRAALMGLKLTLGFIRRVDAGKWVLRTACAGQQARADDEPNSHIEPSQQGNSTQDSESFAHSSTRIS